MKTSGETSSISRLTLAEKAALLSGGNVWQSRAVPRVGVPAIWLSDGPHGVRKQLGSADHLGLNGSEPATCFPTAATVANSWDPALAEEIGVALGAEAAAQGVHVLLGPGLNIKRSPLGGRSFEYFSEDPLLSGRLAAAYVRGIQSRGVAATPKHFAVNSQELIRMASDSVVDERTLRELYLTGFEIVVRESAPWALMTGYNLVNGTYANENAHLLQRILRDEWGFDGLVVSDWGGGNDAVEATRNGSTLEMPSPGFDSARQIAAAVEAGDLDEAALDERVAELLTLIERTRATPPEPVNAEAHHALARRAAAESAVLLRNENGILPLPGGTRVAVIGQFAQEPRYQGAGSSAVNATRVATATTAIAQSGLELTRYAAGFRRDGRPDEALRGEALEAAREADVVLLYLGLPEIAESEGVDRSQLGLPAVQNALVRDLAAVNPRVVVIVSAGGAIELPWIEDCAALIHGYLGGQAGAEGIVDVLTGAVNPSGHLAETLPLRLDDTPTAERFPSTGCTAEYREGLYVGYRYYETADVPVAFPFGFGLGYTDFAYSDLAVTPDAATFTVTNIGAREGSAVPQVYVSRAVPGRVYRPRRELRGFEKVLLRAGETRAVRVPLGAPAFRYFDVESDAWQVEAGEYVIELGADASDIRARATLDIDGTIAAGELDAALRPYAEARVHDIPDASFAALLGRDAPASTWEGAEITANDPILTLRTARSPLARWAFRLLDRRKRRAEDAGTPDLNILFIYNMPFRAIAKMSGGMASTQLVDGLLILVNGRHLRGLGQIVRAYFRARRKEKIARRALTEGRSIDLS